MLHPPCKITSMAGKTEQHAQQKLKIMLKAENYLSISATNQRQLSQKMYQ